MPNYVRPRTDEYYASLAETCAWYRSRSFFDLEAAARRLFQTDVDLALRLYQKGIFTADSIPQMANDIKAMILRPKYAELVADQYFRFYITSFGDAVFEPFDFNYLMQKYARALGKLSPDTEHLVLPYVGYEDVRPIDRSTTL